MSKRIGKVCLTKPIKPAGRGIGVNERIVYLTPGTCRLKIQLRCFFVGCTMWHKTLHPVTSLEPDHTCVNSA